MGVNTYSLSIKMDLLIISKIVRHICIFIKLYHKKQKYMFYIIIL